MINYHSLCYFCDIVGHFGFYPPKNPPMNIQSKYFVCLVQTLYKAVVQKYFGKKFGLGFFQLSVTNSTILINVRRHARNLGPGVVTYSTPKLTDGC